jgi:hypothetical protein
MVVVCEEQMVTLQALVGRPSCDLKYFRTRSSVVSGVADGLVEPMYADGGGDLCEEWNIILDCM